MATVEINNDSDNGNNELVASTSTFDINQLPPSFQAFLDANDIDPKIYTVEQLPRYLRLNTSTSRKILPTLKDLQAQLKTDQVWEIQGLKDFFGFRLNAQKTPRLMDINAYKKHLIFGIDLSSAIAVEALEIQPNDHVLDLCCAPGAKLCMISNILGMDGSGTATGVDIASHRLATCRAMIKKNHVAARVRLYLADGTTFDIPAPPRLGQLVFDDNNNNDKNGEGDNNNNKNDASVSQHQQQHPPTEKQDSKQKSEGDSTADHSLDQQAKEGDDNDNDEDEQRKRRKLDTTTKKPFFAPKVLRYETPSLSSSPSGRLYDKVLVDAECTHDGSISHILKYETWGWDAFEKNFMDTNRLGTICQLQRDLMKQGWSLLKKDGYMVYSTCSLTIKQNEENVAWFLKQHPEAHLEKVPLVDDLDIQLATIKRGADDDDIQTLMDKYCIRFDPLISRTSGFFLARFRKQ